MDEPDHVSDAARVVMERCDELARISEDPDVLVRPFATAAMARADELVGSWMRAAGLRTYTDAAGNLVGRRRGVIADAPTLLLGSHLDTVRDAGAYDGPLGVLVALGVLERRRAEGRLLPFGVDVLGFADEEGLRFGTAYLGSRAVAGTFPPELLDVTDVAGTTVREALRAFGGDPDGLPSASRAGDDLLGYCEVHIEQGPLLEAAGEPVAVVSAIAGATRAEVRFRGEAGHAGTVPMDARRDALTAAAEWVLAVERTGHAEAGLVATVGTLTPDPGAPNVVPGAVRATVDVRHPDDAVRERAVAAIREEAERIAAERDVRVGWRPILDDAAVEMDPDLTAALRAAAAGCGHGHGALASGAGHDAVALAACMPVAMLFVRCAGGVSHSPSESVATADVAAAMTVLDAFLDELAAPWT